MIHQPPHVTEKVEKLDLDFLDIKKKLFFFSLENI
jgi:hypothetical protein